MRWLRALPTVHHIIRCTSRDLLLVLLGYLSVLREREGEDAGSGGGSRGCGCPHMDVRCFCRRMHVSQFAHSHMPLFLLNKSPANRLPQSRMAGSADGCSNASLAKQRLQEREWCSCLDATTASLHFFLIVAG
jgi:hypothetical protein